MSLARVCGGGKHNDNDSVPFSVCYCNCVPTGLMQTPVGHTSSPPSSSKVCAGGGAVQSNNHEGVLSTFLSVQYGQRWQRKGITRVLQLDGWREERESRFCTVFSVVANFY